MSCATPRACPDYDKCRSVIRRGWNDLSFDCCYRSETLELAHYYPASVLYTSRLCSCLLTSSPPRYVSSASTGPPNAAASIGAKEALIRCNMNQTVRLRHVKVTVQFHGGHAFQGSLVNVDSPHPGFERQAATGKSGARAYAEVTSARTATPGICLCVPLSTFWSLQRGHVAPSG